MIRFATIILKRDLRFWVWFCLYMKECLMGPVLCVSNILLLWIMCWIRKRYMICYNNCDSCITNDTLFIRARIDKISNHMNHLCSSVCHVSPLFHMVMSKWPSYQLHKHIINYLDFEFCYLKAMSTNCLVVLGFGDLYDY